MTTPKPTKCQYTRLRQLQAREQVLCRFESSKSMNDIKAQACLTTAKKIRFQKQIEHDTRRYALLP